VFILNRLLFCLALSAMGLTAFIDKTFAQGNGFRQDLINRAAPDEPLDVAVGVRITQITGVDQKSENFGVVARIRMRWQDDALSFDPRDVQSHFRTMTAEAFLRYARENSIGVPAFSIENQQTRSFDKAFYVTWAADGSALLAQEVIVTLQAPDFDFRHFPFDHQAFYLRILANLPSEFIRFEPMADANGVGDMLGEEEWVVSDTWTEIDEVEGISGFKSSRFSLGFSAHRHLLYYWARIFVPLLLLLTVTWANLFLEEYRRRIDVAAGNLLAFIAYNFAISGDLPRLGYLTFLDSLMLAMFAVSVASVAYNVALRRLAVANRESRAAAVDWHVTLWGFPLLIVSTIIVLCLVFFL
jgi:hypothetical protein